MASHSSHLCTGVITLTGSLSGNLKKKEAVASGESLFPPVNGSNYFDEVFEQ